MQSFLAKSGKIFTQSESGIHCGAWCKLSFPGLCFKERNTPWGPVKMPHMSTCSSETSCEEDVH